MVADSLLMVATDVVRALNDKQQHRADAGHAGRTARRAGQG
jgi:hypothetical protein